MNPRRIAQLLRERAALDIELANAFEEVEHKAPRKRPQAVPTVPASKEVVDQVRRKLRSKGVAA